MKLYFFFFQSYIWILTEVMDTSLDRFYAKLFALELTMTELFMSKVAFAVLSALEYMRKLKLMHRDIKPSNILINASGEIKVCDFGISGFTTNSVCSTFKGCQRYMPVKFTLILVMHILIIFLCHSITIARKNRSSINRHRLLNKS